MLVLVEADLSDGFTMFLRTSAWNLLTEDAEETTIDLDHLTNATICVWNT